MLFMIPMTMRYAIAILICLLSLLALVVKNNKMISAVVVLLAFSSTFIKKMDGRGVSTSLFYYTIFSIKNQVFWVNIFYFVEQNKNV